MRRTLLSWSSLNLRILENASVSKATSSDGENDSDGEENKLVESQENTPRRRLFDEFPSLTNEDLSRFPLFELKIVSA